MDPQNPAARIDCHVHSMYSPDGRGSLRELVATAKAKGLTGLCVTDHNSRRMADDMRAATYPDFPLIPGIEVSTQEGHCLVFGVRGDVGRGLPLVETVELAEKLGGVAVPSHPLRRVHGVGEAAVLSVGPALKAIEVYNARDGPKKSNLLSQELARRAQLGGTGGSDAHQIIEVGNAFTILPNPVDDVDDFLDQIHAGRTWGQGTPTPRSTILGQNIKNAWLWTKRGFRGI